jgi:hypothetical protein
MREKKEAKRALYTAIHKLAESSTNFEGDQAVNIVQQAAVAYAVTGLLDAALPFPPGDPTYRSRRTFEPHFSETSRTEPPSDPYDGIRRVLQVIDAVRAADPSIRDA